MERLVINTGSSIGAGDGNNFRFALQQTEGNFTTLYDNPFPLLFPFTGSAQMTASAGQTDAVLIVTGAQDPGFNPAYSPAIEVSGTENYISSSKIIWDNGIYGYLSNLQQGDANDESYFELAGSSQWFFKPGSFNNTILFSNSSNFISFNHSANSGFEGFIYGQSTNYPLISFRVGSNQNRIGINKTNPTTTMDLEINGGVSSSAYFASQIPDIDPEDSTKWFHANSDEVFGIPGNRILCKSQGPGPLVTDGLKYMLAPGITINHLDPVANYSSPANDLNYYFSSSIRYGAQMPTASTWNLFNDANQSITSFQVQNFSGTLLPRPLYYFNCSNSFFSSLRYNISIDNTIFEGGATDPSTLIFWWHPSQNTGTRGRIVAGCDNDFFSIFTRGSSFGSGTSNEQLFFRFGGTPDIEIPYFASSFPVDVDDWVMFALNFEGGSGVVDYKMYFSGSTGGYKAQGQTLSSFDIDANDAFKIGLSDGIIGTSGGSILELSCFLYYSRSISEAEFTDIYHYFSGSHGF